MDHLAGNLIISIVAFALLAILIGSRMARQRRTPVGQVLSGPFEIYIDSKRVGLEHSPQDTVDNEYLRPREITLDFTFDDGFDFDALRYWYVSFAWANYQYRRRTFNTYGPAYHRATTETTYYD